MSGGGWRPALRIARRDALRTRARSALVIAMVALPVLALTTVDVLARSAQLDPGERLDRDLGAAQARLYTIDGHPLVQAPDPDDGVNAVPGRRRAANAPRTVSELTPAGYRALTERSRDVWARTRAGVGNARWTEVAVGDPAFRGRFRLDAGRPPRTRDEVAVSPRLLERLGASVGARVRLERPERTLRITGAVQQRLVPDEQTFWAPPGSLIARGGRAVDYDAIFLAGPRPVTWRMVRRFNAIGIVALSRAVVAHPPPAAAVPEPARSWIGAGGGIAASDVLGATVIIVLAALEVALLAGAAFAVGARRQARALALVVAAGGSPGDVRRIVLAGGLVLGAAGAAAGVVGGLGLAALVRPLIERASGDAVFGHFDVHPAELAAIALFGLLTGGLAAVLPARTAARQDPVAALAGRRPNAPTPRRVPVIGVLLAACGAGLAALGSALALALTTSGDGSRTSAAALIAGGAALTQIGLIVCSPAVVGLAARWARVLPLAPRLALRDAARHRGRSAPAMAAVLTAVTASTALALYVAALDAQDRSQYTARWPARSAGVTLTGFEDVGGGHVRPVPVDPDAALRAIRGRLPAATATVVDAFEPRCSGLCGVVPRPHSRLGAIPINGGFAGTPVIDSKDLAAVTGASTPAARAALDRGGVVVFDRGNLRPGGTAVVRLPRGAGGGRRHRLPAAVLRAPYVPAAAILGHAAARRLGVHPQAGTLLLTFAGRLPSADDEDAARAALSAAGIDAELSVERGYRSRYGLGLLALVLGAAVITLGAAGIATGLAQADARPDHATLAAIGAPPGMRRTLAAAQSLAITALGTVLGILAGFVPAVALIAAAPSLELTLPWAQLAAILVAVPLLAGALAWLLTRSRMPLEHRVA